MKRILTLCIIHNNTHILLGMKSRGFGEGRWNGFGGKVEEGIKREVREECKIVMADVKKRGILNFSFRDKPEVLEVHVFSGSKFRGEPAETEEMRPQWFRIEEIPYDQMWPDDRHWLPLLLSGKNFKGDFHFLDNNTLDRHTLREI